MTETAVETRSAPAAVSSWRELPVLVAIAVGVALLIRIFVVQVFYIPSGSMEGTLDIGDRVLVNKAVYQVRDVERGDVIVFDGTDSFAPEVTVNPPSNPVQGALRWLGGAAGFVPSGERDFIKRVIGVGGDHVRCCDVDGRITVNGVALDESPYLYPGDAPSEDAFDVIVPQGKLWVMGDHRSASSDSRAHLGDPGGGMVSVDRVIGRAVAVAWPVGHWSQLPIPATFDSPALAGGAN